jgi:ribosomal-protein-alanine N-acetyltransferase
MTTCPRTDTAMDTLRVNLRWACRGDLESLASLEAACYSDAWPKRYFRTLMEQNYPIIVATVGEGVVAYMVYHCHKHDVNLVNLTVHPDYRRRRIGYQLLARLLSSLAEMKCSRVTYLVRESELIPQVFLRAFGFVALRTWKRHFEDTGEDGYYMAYGESAWVAFNRIAGVLEKKN